MWTQQNPEGNVVAIAIAPDGGTLYAQDSMRTYTAWDLATRTGRRLFADPETVGASRRVTNHFPRLYVSPNGRFLVSNTSPALVWDLASLTLHAVVPDEHSFAGVSVGDSHDRVTCVTSDWLGISTWDFARKEPGPEYRDWPVSGTIKTHHFNSDGRRMALLDWEERVIVCEVESRKAIQTVPSLAGRQLQHCRFAPDGETLVVYAADHVALWDLVKGSALAERVECDRPYWVLAFHPTQPLIAVRRTGGLLVLIDLRTGREVQSLDLGLGPVLACAAFSPDGLTCAAAGGDGRFALIDVDA